MPKQASANFLRALHKLGQQFVKSSTASAVSKTAPKPSKPWQARQPGPQFKQFRIHHNLQLN
ncbi:MAG: hypothetical protein ACPIOQ_54435 [Promethearchaeia archaeon]